MNFQEYSEDSGIYQITCIPTGKIYIGSAVNFGNRKRTHFNSLKNLKHDNKHLQNAYKKYGEENFTFDILEFVPINQLIDAEQTYLDLIFDPELFDQEMRFNILPHAGNTLGYRFSDEEKLKISIGNKGKFSGDKNPFFGKKHPKYIQDQIAEKHRGLKHTDETRKKISVANKGKAKSKESLEKSVQTKIERYGGSPVRKPVAQLDIKTKEIIAIHESATAAAKALGITKGGISATCRRHKFIQDGKEYIVKSAAGFDWKFIDEKDNENEL